jgi:hypothetical protein
MPARFVDVIVAAHAALPDGCAVTFQVLGAPRPVSEVRYRPGLGGPGVFAAEGRTHGGAAAPAQATPVHVPGAGPHVLVTGGAWGLRLTRVARGGATSTTAAAAIAEPYLLLGDADIVR